MKKIMFTTLALCLILLQAKAQKKKKQDIDAIKAMCGCYDVQFNFAETFAHKKDYQFHNNYITGGLEYVFPVEESKDKIVLQHLLVIGDSMIIKHWRQDWIYENTDLYTYDKDNTWKYVSLPKSKVGGQWTQKVYQVDDSPRYEGTASWVHVDGRHYWEGTADAPLPRREASKRKDYNVMERRNRQEITSYGWVHEQDNNKVKRSATGDETIAEEKGWNTYRKTSEDKCQLAKNWWVKNQKYWAQVRQVWDELFATKETLTLNMKVDGQILFMRLFELGNQVSESKHPDKDVSPEIKKIIRTHLKNTELLVLK